ncbi:LysR substrate-binding domain-containing protein [Bacillus salipaludis]|uniref:LysR substrate-binding domain-containing protein n=1 Tax=Bacillus salipaludis TaxID=2547811 RepID=A0ABW8RAL4_9BACI
MDSTQLETFLTIVEYRNYSKTAEVLNVTQPTVTARIKNLENELNCKLFQREGKNVVLTLEGEVFIEYATKIITYMNNSIEAVRKSKTPIIKVGFCPGVSSSFILETVGALKENNILLSITEGEDSIPLIDKVKKGELDLVFVRNLVSYEEDLVSEYLFDDKFVLILGENHRLADQETITLDDLFLETLICYSPNHPVWSSIEQKLEGIPDLRRIQVKNQDILKTFVKNNWGISFSPFLGIDESEKNQIITKEIDEISSIPNKVNVIYRKNSLIEKYLKKMIYSFIGHEVKTNRIPSEV